MLKPKPEPERPGAEICMHDSESQFLGTSMRTLVSVDLEGNRIAGVGGRGGHQQCGENVRASS